jgi:hypothetical protein
MGVAYIQGMQGDDPDRIDVVATPKHYAVHSGPEAERHEINVFVSKHDLVDTYLPAFRAAIVEGRAGSIMCAYNRVDGQPACASDLLLKNYLREAWGRGAGGVGRSSSHSGRRASPSSPPVDFFTRLSPTWAKKEQKSQGSG